MPPWLRLSFSGGTPRVLPLDSFLQVGGGCVEDEDGAREVCRKLQQLLLKEPNQDTEETAVKKANGHRALTGV